MLISVLCFPIDDEDPESVLSLSKYMEDEWLDEIEEDVGLINEPLEEESYVLRRNDLRCRSLSIRKRASSNWFSRSRIRRFWDCDWLRIPFCGEKQTTLKQLKIVLN